MFLNLNTSMKDKIMSYAIYLQSFFLAIAILDEL